MTNSKNYESQRSEEHTSELQSQSNLVCRLLLEKKYKCQSPRIGTIAVSVCPHLGQVRHTTSPGFCHTACSIPHLQTITTRTSAFSAMMVGVVNVNPCPAASSARNHMSKDHQ